MIAGIDPGVAGAIAVLSDVGSIVALHDMPTVEVRVGKGKRNRIVGALLADILRDANAQAPGLRIVLENVNPMPRDGCMQAFGLGYAKGVAEGVAASLLLPLTLLTPASWKAAMGLNADKGRSRMMAIRIWPAWAKSFARVKDDGRAEAALLALHHHQITTRKAAP